MIAEKAFENRTSLTSIIIPEEVEYVGSMIFYGCDENLTINCEAMSKPTNWSVSWNWYQYSDGSALTTNWAYGKPITLFPASGTTYVSLTDKGNDHIQYIYDDGGPGAVYSPDCDGYIVLQAAAGKGFLISGLIDADKYNNPYLEVCNGDINDEAIRIGRWGNGNITVVTGNIASLEFSGSYGNGAPGLALTAKIIDEAVVEDGFAYADVARTTLIAYFGNETSVAIPSSVTTIKSGAFNGRGNVALIPTTVTTIESGAFNSMSLICAVEEDNVPAGWADDWASGKCQITWGTTTLPDFVYSIVNASSKTVELVACNSTDANVVIPTTVEIDGDDYTVTRIASLAFANNTTMTAVTIPSGITKIAFDAFAGCDNLATVNFNATYCSSLGDWNTGFAFSNNSNITTVNFGDNVQNIPENAFKDCSGITSVSIPNSVENIGYSAFSSCYNLETVTLGNSVSNINSYAFSYCGNIASVELPNSVTFIGDYAFCNSDIETVDIPATVWSFGSMAFSGYSLTAINIDEENNNYKSVDGVLYSKDGTELIAYPRAKAGTSFVVPDDVITIYSNAFSENQYLTSVTLGSNVETIGSSAFSYVKLTEITIPESVTSIGSSAFSYCYSLQTVNYNATNCTEMGYEWSRVFNNCSSLKNLNIGDNVESIPSYAFSGCYSLNFVQIPATVESIGEDAFYNVKSIAYSGEAEDVYGNNWGANKVIRGVIDGDFAYADNTKKALVAYLGSASDVSIPSTVETIGEGAFKNNSTLVSVSIPSTVKTIASEAFYNCDNLASVRIPSSVTSIDVQAFYDCGNLMIVTIPQQVEAIGEYAFPCGAQIYCEIASRPDGWNSSWRYCENEWTTFWNTQPSDDYGTVDIVCAKRINYVEEDLATANEYIIEVGEMIADPWENQFFIQLSPEHALVEGEKYRLSMDIKSDQPSTIYFNMEGHAERGDLINLDMFNYYSKYFYNTYQTWNFTGTVDSERAGVYTFAINLSNYTGANTYYFRNIVFEELYIPEVEEFEFEVLSSEDHTAYISKYNGKDANVVIPSTVEIDGVEYTVTSIGNNAFLSNTTAKTVDIPNTVTNIEYNAFYGCRNLEEISIPNSVTTIGNCAFYNCKKLETLTIPESVTSIGDWAFDYCSNLKTLNYNATNAWVSSNSAFSNTVTTLNIGNTVTTIGGNAFNNCTNLETANVPASVVNMGYNVFAGCTNATTINCEWAAKPRSWNNYWNGSNATVVWGDVPVPEFEFTATGDNTAELTGYFGEGGEVVIPATATIGGREYNVTSIGYGVFNNSSNRDKIESVVIGSNVETIGSSAFTYCQNLTSVTLGESVETIGNYAFSNCPKLASIDIPASVTSIGGGAFNECVNLASVTMGENVETIGYQAFCNCPNLTSIDIPASVTTIEYNAFNGCRLRKVFIPNTVAEMGSGIFYNPDGGLRIYCQCAEDDQPDDWAYDWHGWNTVIWGATSITEYDWVTYSYWEWNGETGEDEERYGAILAAYYGTDAEIEIPETVMLTIDGEEVECTVTQIGDYAFKNCSSITSVSIPATVTYVGYRAFSDCPNLTEIVVDGENPRYYSNDGVLFDGSYTSLVAYPAGKTDTDFEVPADVKGMSDYAFSGNSYLETVTIPSGNITYIGGGLFQNCSSLQTVVLPDEVTHISSWAFSNCTSLAEITIPASVEQMEWNVFTGDNNLTIYCEVSAQPNSWSSSWNYNGGKVIWGEVELPEFEYEIDDYYGTATVIRYNGHATEVEVPMAYHGCPVTAIGHQAFQNCSNLTKVVLPDQLRQIEYNAFSGCGSLESINLSNVTYIGSYAFSGCGFTELELPAGAEIYEGAFNYNWRLRTVLVPATTVFPVDDEYGNGGGKYVFNNINNATIVCFAAEKPDTWNDYWANGFNGTIIWNAKKVTLAVNDNTLGTVSGAGYYTKGSEVTVTATANAGCSFTGWTEAVGAPAVYNILVNSDITLTANFESGSGYKVTALSNNESYGTVSGGGYFEYNAEATLTATPKNGYSFMGWYNSSNDFVDGSLEYTFDVTGTTTLTAKFAKTYYVQTGVNSGYGEVYVKVNGNWVDDFWNSYEVGTEIYYLAVPNEGYTFWSWTDGESSSERTFTVNGESRIYAKFKPNEYQVAATVYLGTGGTVDGSGTYEHGQTATLTATPAEGYRFVDWVYYGEQVSTDPSYSFTVTGEVDGNYLYARFSNKYTVTAVAGEHGSVDGGNVYTYGQTATLTATANTGFHFVGWSNGTEYVSDEEEFSFTVTEAVSLTAEFEIDSYAIAVAAGENGSVSGSATGTYNYGQELTVVASADEGYHFAGWSNGTTIVSDVEEYTFSASQAVSLTATFDINSYAVTIAACEHGAITGAESDDYDYGTVLNLVAEPANGYRFVRWNDNNTDQERAYRVTGNATLSAVFTENAVLIYTVSANAEHGTVDGTGNYESGESVTLTAVADLNYKFVGWEDGVQSATRSFVANANVVLTALFEPEMFNITVIADHGTVTGDGEHAYDSEVTISVEPNFGYEFAGWSDGETESERTFTVEGDETFTALFEPIIYTITIEESEGGVVTGGGDYAYDTEITLTATNSKGYKFYRWSDGSDAGYLRKYTVKGNATLSAEFIPRNTVIYPINAVAQNGTVTGVGSYPAGTVVKLTAVPDNGYKFKRWSDGETEAEREVTVTQESTFTAEFEPETYTITVLAQNGEVTGGGDYLFGRDDVELTATAADNYHFVGWSDGVATATRTITVEGNATYTALFAPDQFTITVVAEHAIVNGGGLADYNSEMTIQVVAEAGYRFMGWTDDENALATRVVKVTGDFTYTATIEEISEYYVTADAQNGHIEGLAESYAPGATAEVTAVADAHYHFVEWGDHITTETRSFKVNNDMTIKAIFEIDKVNITFTAENGTVEGAGPADYGKTITLRAVPNDGYRFVKWSDGVTTVSRNVTPTSDMSFTAEFKLATIFTINVIAGKGGTVTKGGEIEINTQMNIVATPDKGYHFVSWNDGNKNPSRTLTVTRDEDFTAEFAPNVYTITTVAFHGVVTGGGKADFGTQVTLTAIPEDGYHFVRWNDGITTETRTIIVSDDATYTAEFEETIYAVTLEATTGGKVEGAGNYKYNNKVNLSAVADKGYHFVKWSDDNTDAAREIVVTANLKLRAIFEPNKYKITIVAENATVSGQGTGEYDFGTTIKPSVRAASGYKFVRWTDGVQSASRSIKVEGDATYTAIITNNEVYTIAATAQNGTVEGANKYAEGENAKLTATANAGYKFIRWSDGATTAERTVKVDGNLNLTAVFADANSTVYNVTAKANNGSVVGASAYVAGETATLTAQPDNNFKFVRWSDGTTNASRTVKVDADYQVEAVFANANDVVCKVTATAKNGTITGTTNYVSGETATFEAVADNGYQFVRWTDGETGATRTVKVESDINLSAVFADAATTVYKVTVKAENGSVSGASNYLQGEVATLTVTANDGYKFIRWSDGVTKETRDVTVKADYKVEAVFAKAEAAVCKITATAENGKVEGVSNYFVGEEATLTAVADAGYSFVRWSDGETKETRSFIVEQDSSFTAIFTDKKVYTVAVAAENGTVAGAGKYVSGEAVTLTATPAEGFEFVGWSDSTFVNPYNFKATADILLTAYFQPDSMTVTVIAENGEVTGVGNYVMGDTVVLTAIAAEGYRFVMWSDSVMENPRTIVVASDTTLTALFEVDQTAINEEEAENVNIFAFGNTIVVENAEADIFVYDAMGRLIDRVIPDAGRTEIQIQGVGIHVVKTGNAAKRVMINKR